MAYARLHTRNTSGLHPNLRGYAPLATRTPAGLNPNFRGLGSSMGAVPAATFSIGPGGQWSIGAASTPTGTSLWDQILTWFSQSSIIAGVPNSVFAIGGGLFLLTRLRHGGHR
jgi:hypothetical protein